MTTGDITLGTWTGPVRNRVRQVMAVIGPDFRDGAAEPVPQPAKPGVVAVLFLIVSAALLLVVLGQGAGRRGEAMAPVLFWLGIALMVVPISFRIAWPDASRGERLLLLLLLVEAMFFCRTVYSPTSFTPHDEYLHWVAADDLMTARRLFLSNPLLEVGSTYQALEILATSLADLTRLPLFASAMLLLAVLKGTFIVALFLLYEKITGSARIAAVGSLAYMGCSTFFLFEAMFSYESLGIVLCALAFAIEAASRNDAGPQRARALLLIGLILGGIAVTHHLSAVYAAIYFGAVATLDLLRRDGSRREARVAIGAVMAVALPLLWMEFRGTDLGAYLGPVIESGVKTLLTKLHGAAMQPPDPLADAKAPSQPLVMRVITLLGVLLTAIGLATGFFRSLALSMVGSGRAGWRSIQHVLERRWSDSRIVFLTVLAFGFPLSVLFRLSIGGWEIGNRMGTLAFFGVGLVVAAGVVHFWQGLSPRGWRLFAPPLALSVIVLSGITSASLDLIRGPYRVAADAQSVEAMAVGTARWTKEWMGPGNRFTSDRVNRLLLAGYGRQDVRLDIAPGVNSARVFGSATLSGDDFWALAQSDVDFLLVDMRLTAAPPVLGFYFEPWEPRTDKPIAVDALSKFEDIEGVGRIYDNGFIRIYDMRGMHVRP
ncbi:hypothetical protein [Rhodopseudomonas telluris]|uniref:Transmembrane protein n=1 Tax=Rhodopseudomonas telluris TaxID=644215 RepID=A0ABV6EWZ7_9BRAD